MGWEWNGMDGNSHSSCARIRQLVGSIDQHRKGETGLVDQPVCTWDDIHVIKGKANFDISEDEETLERLQVFLANSAQAREKPS